MTEETELRAIQVIRANNNKTTLPSLTAQLGTDRMTALQTLKALMRRYDCTLQVTEEGGIIYDFGEFVPAGQGEGGIRAFLRDLWDLWKDWMAVVAWTTMASIGPFLKIIEKLTTPPNKPGNVENTDKDSDGDTDDEDQDNDDGDIDDIEAWKNMINLAGPGPGSRVAQYTMPDPETIRKIPRQKRLNMEFGSLKYWKIRKKWQNRLFMDYVNSVGGVVTPMEWALLFDTDLKEAEGRITALYAEYEADVNVSESGELVFDFSAVLGKDFGAAPAPAFFRLAFMRQIVDPGMRVFLYLYTLIALLDFAGFFGYVPAYSFLMKMGVNIDAFIAHLPVVLHGVFYLLFGVGLLLLPVTMLLNLFFYAFMFGGILLGIAVSLIAALFGYHGEWQVLAMNVMFGLLFLWGIASLLAFFTMLFEVIGLSGLLKNRDLWFRMALHARIMQSDDGIPADPWTAAAALNNVSTFPVPLPSDKGFTMAIAALEGELNAPEDPEKQAVFVFPRIRAQKEAVDLRNFRPIVGAA